MKTIETHLFIGGDMDGKFKALPWNHSHGSYVRFPKFTRNSYAISHEAEQATLEYVMYRRERLRSEETIYDVWVLDSMTITEAMERLLGNYRPEMAVKP